MCLVSILFFAFIVLLSCNAVSSESIRWHSYDEGVALAKNTGKKVFLYFYTDQCGYCDKMKSKTFSNSTVASYLNENFIPVKVNAAKERNLSKEYNVRGVPATWFIAENEEKIRNRPGFLPPDQLLAQLKYVATDSYKTIKFDDFVKTLQ